MSEFFDLDQLENFYLEHPDSIVFAFLSLRHLEENRPEKALEIAEKGVQKHPAYSFGHYVLGKCYHTREDKGKAKTHLELALAYDDKNPQASRLLGEISQQLELPLMAQESFTQYYLVDYFNEDATRKFSQAEMGELNALDSLSFDLDENTTSESSDIDLGVPERRTAEQDDITFDDFLDAEETADLDKIDISEKVGEVFKHDGEETLLDNPLDDLDNDDFSSLDETFENLELLEFDDTPSTEAGDPSVPGEAEDTALFQNENEDLKAEFEDIDSAFESLESVDDLFEESPAAPEKAKEPESEDFQSLLDDLENIDLDDMEKGDTETPMDPEPKSQDAHPDKTEVTDRPVTQEPETEPLSAAPLDGEGADDDDIMAELDEFFAEYEKTSDTDTTDPQPDDSQDVDLGTILFDDEEAVTLKSSSPEASEDDFDFSALVDELTDESDTADDTAEAPPAPEQKTLPTAKPDIDLKAAISSQDKAARSTAPDKSSFGRPPILSPTLGEIYISQERFEEAIDVFKKLMQKDPDNKRYQKKIRDIQKLLDSPD